MKEIPILFNTMMVQAILEGRKTMTRRIVKFPKEFNGESVYKNGDLGLKYSVTDNVGNELIQRLSPPYEKGDRLWVRETFQIVPPNMVFYKADKENKATGNWKPSIHMPKAAARIWLEVVSRKVERLQDITEEDAIREGIQHNPEAPPSITNKGSFAKLWESINGKGSWDANQCVWVVEFKRIEP